MEQALLGCGGCDSHWGFSPHFFQFPICPAFFILDAFFPGCIDVYITTIVSGRQSGA
jgi:hypothetical protein